MDAMTAAEFWSLVSSIVSTILGIGAIAPSVYFFVASKRTEREVATALTKIETQTEMLQKLTGKPSLPTWVRHRPPGSLV